MHRQCFQKIDDIKWGDVLQPRAHLPMARMVSLILSDMYSVQLVFSMQIFAEDTFIYMLTAIQLPTYDELTASGNLIGICQHRQLPRSTVPLRGSIIHAGQPSG